MKKKVNLSIELKNVTKKYTISHEKPTFIENILKRGYKEKFTALKKISLKINKGEKIGIVGSNGAGKTTLLKVITGITEPTSGKVSLFGKISSLIDLEAGFHPDLTGEENIFINGMLIGMKKSEIKKSYKKIVEFAELGSFIDAPLYTYSQGMKLRLGFSVAAFSDPDIFILDEGIYVGDDYFQAKCDKKINEFLKQNKTIILVSHWLPFLKSHAKRFIWVDKGRIREDGKYKVVKNYLNSKNKKN
ncbi:ABC transporter ATP-binding protein [Candidatus Woesearchaeota archaeon]|jgi:teichoic acid transport system ATP-binding protein|nr:ABC transporter ATP-binding protein [Candidatus Paceibacterota bacterium]MBT6756382.1 ABC transporter ATP-binding protein [Candidatus Paceibacterota bacterium]MBT6921323.1 ABC transporter ATP-binding protein [Candidatus Paceibacterota bacterium]MBT7237470.1 ABC transporter ATP-binding protein [Candidatus Woesearchaeota archaeon]